MVKLIWLLPAPALAHVSEGRFVLLLPTDVYRSVGVAVVALTVLILIAAPDRWVARLFRQEPSRAVSVVGLQTME